MEFLDLKRMVYDCPLHFKTRQHIWQHCIERIKPGDIGLEFGVWRGTSINYFANARPDNTFGGFDSFEGLPEDWIERHPKGTFKVTDKSELKFARNVVLHQGWFQDSIPAFRHANQACLPHISFIHIDCDLGSSTSTILNSFEDVIRNNKPMLLFDEFYNYRGFEEHEMRAFLNFANRTGLPFEVVGRNIHHQQVLIQPT